MKYVGITAVTLGALLVLASLLWRSLITQDTLMTTEQAEAYTNASAQLHNDSFTKQEGSEELAASRAAYEAERAEFERALAFRDRTPIYLRIAGFCVCALGAGLLFVVRRRLQRQLAKP
jgi:uncharacterized protein YjeT (DUF2065 family)